MTQTATARPLSRSARPGPSTTPRPLRAVSAAVPKGHGGFVAFCLTVLVGGLLGVLMLNTAIAQDSFALRSLKDRSDELADTQDALGHAIDAQSAPARLAQRAASLGMVPAQSPAFLRLSDGKVLGVAAPAKAVSAPTVVAQGPQTPGAAAGASGARAASAAAPPAEPAVDVRVVGAQTVTTTTWVRGTTRTTTVRTTDTRTGTTSTRTSTAAAVPHRTPTPRPAAH